MKWPIEETRFGWAQPATEVRDSYTLELSLVQRICCIRLHFNTITLQLIY